jgi:hypothetical protein
MKNDKCTL